MKKWHVLLIVASWMAGTGIATASQGQGQQTQNQQQQQQALAEQGKKGKTTTVTGVILAVSRSPQGEFIQVRPDASGQQEQATQAAKRPIVLIIRADTRITLGESRVSSRSLETGMRVKVKHIAKAIVYDQAEESPDPKLGKNYRAVSIAILG